MVSDFGLGANHALDDWSLGSQPKIQIEQALPVGAPSPGTIQGAPPRSVGRPCGQCDAQGNVFCTQCRETYCWTCASAIHQRGKLAYHTGVDLLTDSEVPLSMRNLCKSDSNLGRQVLDSRETASTSHSPELDLKETFFSKGIATNSLDGEVPVALRSWVSPQVGHLSFSGSANASNRQRNSLQHGNGLKHDIESGLASHLSRLRLLTEGITDENELETSMAVDSERQTIGEIHPTRRASWSEPRGQTKSIKQRMLREAPGANGKLKSSALPKQYARVEDKALVMSHSSVANGKVEEEGKREQMLVSMIQEKKELERKLQVAKLAIDASEVAGLQDQSASQSGDVADLKKRLDIVQAAKEHDDRKHADEKHKLQLEISRLRLEAHASADVQTQLETFRKHADEQHNLQLQLSRLKLEAQVSADAQNQLEIVQAAKIHDDRKYAEEQHNLQLEISRLKLEAQASADAQNRLDIVQATKERDDRKHSDEQRNLQHQLSRLKLEAQASADAQNQLDIVQAAKMRDDRKYVEEQHNLQLELSRLKLEAQVSADVQNQLGIVQAAKERDDRKHADEQHTLQLEISQLKLEAQASADVQHRLAIAQGLKEEHDHKYAEEHKHMQLELSQYKLEVQSANLGSVEEERRSSLKERLHNSVINKEKQQLKQECVRFSSTIAQLEKQNQSQDEHQFASEVEQMHSELLKARDEIEDAHMKASRLVLTANSIKLEQTLEAGEAQQLAAKVTDLQHKLSNAQSELEVAERSREDKRTEMFILQDRADKAQIRTTQLTTLVQDLESQLGNANSALTEADRMVRRSKGKSSNFESEVDNLRMEARQSEDLLQASRFATNEELKAMREKLDNSFSDSDNLHSIVEDLKQQLRDSQSSVLDQQAHDSEVCSMRIALQEAQHQRDTFHQNSEEYQSRYHKMWKEFEEVQAQSVEMKRDEDKEHALALQVELERFKALAQSQEVTIAQCERAEGEARARELNAQTSETQAVLEAENASERSKCLQVELASMEAKEKSMLDELQEQPAGDETRHWQLECQSVEERAQNESEQLLKKIESWQAEAASAKKHESQADSDLQATMQDLVQARVEVDRARKELDKLQSAPTARLQKLQDREVQDEMSKLEQALSEKRILASELQEANEDLQSKKARLEDSDRIRQQLETVREELEESRAECKESSIEAPGPLVGVGTSEELESIKNEREKLRASFKESRADVRRLKRENEDLQKRVSLQILEEPLHGGHDQAILQSELSDLRGEGEKKDAELAEAASEVHDLQQKLREARLSIRKAQEEAGLVRNRSERRDRRSLMPAVDENRPKDENHHKEPEIVEQQESLPEASAASSSVTWM